MNYLIAFATVIAVFIVLGLFAVVWACCAVASDADDAMEKWKQSREMK